MLPALPSGCVRQAGAVSLLLLAFLRLPVYQVGKRPKTPA